jgi:6-pyruvoyl-tetrahydropterin synthase related domain
LLRPLLIIMATAFAVVLPFSFLGIPSGHDFEFHMNSWMEVLGQWKLAIIYPRWAALAHYGCGEPRFIFYPPASWTLGAILGAILPWKLVPGTFVWLVLSLSGYSMFLLARGWLARRDAIFAAALYVANPYHLVVVYWRSAFAELLGGALLPLLLFYVLRAENGRQRVVLPISLIVAAAWLTNIPCAVMVSYSLAFLMVMVAIGRRSPRILWQGGLAVLLGAALSAFYILPVAYEKNWITIAQVLAPGVRPQDNFLFTLINDPDHNRFNLLVSVIAEAEIIVLAGAVFLSRRWRRSHTKVWWTLIGWAAAGTLLMFSFTFVAWQHLPELRYLQHPWRWLLCLNVALMLLVTMAWRSWPLRLLVCVVMLAVLALGWKHIQPPWWDTAADIAQLQQSQQNASGYEGTDEYTPAGADAYEIKLNARGVTFEGAGTARIHVRQWAPETKMFTAEVSQPGRLILRLFNYPAWRVEVNGNAVLTKSQEVTGQMIVPVEAGENRVLITFTRTWDRTLGGIVSGATALFLVGLVALKRK